MLKLKSAQLTRSEHGPDHIVVALENETGEAFDFERAEPKGTGEKYLRRLGFTSCTLIQPGERKRANGRGTYNAPVESELTL